MIHGSDFKAQPMDTKKEQGHRERKKPTELNSKDYEAIRKLVKYNDKPIQNIK